MYKNRVLFPPNRQNRSLSVTKFLSGTVGIKKENEINEVLQFVGKNDRYCKKGDVVDL